MSSHSRHKHEHDVPSFLGGNTDAWHEIESLDLPKSEKERLRCEYEKTSRQIKEKTQKAGMRLLHGQLKKLGFGSLSLDQEFS